MNKGISYNGKSVSEDAVFKSFKYLAGSNLRECTSEGFDVLAPYSNVLCGNNVELTKELLANALNIAFKVEGEPVECSNQIAAFLVSAKGGKPNINFNMDIEGTLSKYGIGGSDLGSALSGSKERAEDNSMPPVMGIDFGSEDEDSEEETKGRPEEVKKEPEKEPEPEKASREDEEDKPVKDPKKEEICNYYASEIIAPLNNLTARYTMLFESGYEVDEPAGILCRDGLVRVSGSERKVSVSSSSTYNMYELLLGEIGFKEVECRSISKIGNTIYESFKSGGELLYFPNKMLEFAYGLEAPTGENQDSLNTYKKHSSAKGWSKYVSSVLTKSITLLLKGLLYGYVVKTMSEKGIEDFRNPEIAMGLKKYFGYVDSCMSTCILLSEYQVVQQNGLPTVSKFTLRVCDPSQTLISKDITPMIISSAFSNDGGKEPFSYEPSVMPSPINFVEYKHEFNHSLANATPLFAYKALESLMRAGKSISWDNLILGRGDDGKILKCGKDGFINLMLKLTHEIDAGSRAGKGVMTLNLLASGIASKKNLAYFDCKPDMSSTLKFMCPEMFVLNGGGYDSNYDNMNQWGPDKTDTVASMNVPQDALSAFGVRSATWTELGDIFYMRGIMLLLGILLARGSGKGSDPSWGGEEGFLIIVDEFRVFQANYRAMMNELFAKVPNVVIDKSRESLNKGNMSQVEFDRNYNDTNYYALSYINALSESLKYLAKKRDAGFDSSEVARSDIFIIGQDLYDGPVDIAEFGNSFIKSSASNRYKTSAMGMNSTFGSTVCGATDSVPYTMLHFKGADAFFGRNIDTNYLAQTNKSSRAYGKLDDKASNFAYMPNFTEDVRKQLNSGKINDNIKLAQDCKYFKPYLILNESGMNTRCVQDMFDRCMQQAGITPEEIISNNPNPSNPEEINPGVGFIDYIAMAGTTDYKESMIKGAVIVQNVVSLLGYQGSWLEFVCDLRPEWMFTVKDIVDIANGVTPDIANPATNPILAEWVEFNPQRFGGDYVDPQVLSANEMDEFLLDDGSGREDFSSEDIFKEADERTADAMGLINHEVFSDENEDIGLWENDIVEDLPDSPEIQDSGVGEEEVPKEVEYLLGLIEKLQNQVNQLKSGASVDSANNPYVEDYTESSYKATETSSFGDNISGLNYKDDVASLDELTRIITKNVIELYGGLDRITSFFVVGGSLNINGYYYRCNIKESCAKSIPYDIRRKVNSGNISELFDYSLISQMPKLRRLRFDSVNFVYDTVSPQMGIPQGTIGVDKFFEALPSLQEFAVGKYCFNRQTYRSVLDNFGEDADVFYKAKTSSKIVNISEGYLRRWNQGAWGFTKRVAGKQGGSKAAKAVGVAAGVSATAVTGVGRVGIGAGKAVAHSVNTKKIRQGVKGFTEGLKDLWNS